MKEYQKKYNSVKYKKKVNNKRIDQSNELDENNKIKLKDRVNKKDDRMEYVLVTLGLSDLAQIFDDNNISFIDLLLLSKESLKELGLEMYQRNRIFNFSTSFNKKAKTYSIKEISKFFNSNRQFLFSPIVHKKILRENKSLNYDSDNRKNNFSKNKNKIKNKYYSYYENYDNDNNKNQEDIDKPPKNRSSSKINYLASSGKTYKASKIFKKYLLIKKGVDEFLNKLNRQKEETENITYKLNNIIKRINSNKDSTNNISDNNSFSYKNILSKKNSTKNLIDNGGNVEGESELLILEDKNKEKSNEKNINNEFNILIEKINNLEKMSVDENSIEHLNQIKNHVNEKGKNIKIDEIISFQKETDKLTEIIIKKEKLKKNLEEYNKKIEERKKMITKLENESTDNKNNNYKLE